MRPAEILMRALLPKGGYVVTWSAYFDESGTDAGNDWLVVAGYIFDDEQFVSVDAKWADMLKSHKDADGNTLPYFHMASCAHNQKVFAKFTKAQCDQIARQAIGIVVDNLGFGFAVSVEKKWQHLIPRHEFYDSPYSFACWLCLQAVSRIADMQKYYGDVLYFFEQGHESQGEADMMMKRIFANPSLKLAYRSAGHGFYDKRKVRPLQCADMLAWHWLTHSKKYRRAGIEDLRNTIVPIRADFQALLGRKPHEHYQMQVYDEFEIKLYFLYALYVLKKKWRRVFALGEELITDTLRRNTPGGKRVYETLEKIGRSSPQDTADAIRRRFAENPWRAP